MAEVETESTGRRYEGAQTSAPQGSGAGQLRESDADALAHLYKMSATAGVATTDYAAINPVSIVALLLGLAGVLTLFADILLLVPVVGVVMGVIALIQIRNSNRTQTGKGFAVAGIVLSMAFGGFVVGRDFMTWQQKRTDEARIASLIEGFGNELTAGKYIEAYSQFSQRFRDRVPQEVFTTTLENINQVPRLGKLSGMRWNGESMLFESNPDSGEQTVTGMVFLQFSLQTDPQREYLKFVRESGPWKIDDIPQLFPSAKQRPGAPRGPRAGP
jgi:hypothetical protein